MSDSLGVFNYITEDITAIDLQVAQQDPNTVTIKDVHDTLRGIR